MRPPDTWLTRRLSWLHKGQWTARTSAVRRAQEIIRAGLFDLAYYRSKYPDLAGGRMSLESHFRDHGAFEGRSPNGVLDVTFYSKQAQREFADPIEANLHYIHTGERSGLHPSPLFDPRYFKAQSPLGAAQLTRLGEYLQTGERAGLRPHPLFDPGFVARQASSEIRRGQGALTFFLNLRSLWTPNPHPLFDSAYYLRTHHEPLRARQNALVHYLSEGAAAGFNPHPLFDTHVFRQSCSGAAYAANALLHYVTDPAAWRCRTHPLFDPDHYVSQRPEAAFARLPLLEHYLRMPPEQQPAPSPLFHPAEFQRRYPQVAELHRDPLTYFAEFRETFQLR